MAVKYWPAAVRKDARSLLSATSVALKNKQSTYFYNSSPGSLPGLFIFTTLAASKQHTLKKQERLKSRKQLEQLFKEAPSFHTGMLKVYHRLQEPAQLEPLLFGVGVGTRHFKKAVHRNRIKRLIREAYRLQKQALKEQLQTKEQTLCIFFIYTGKELPLYEPLAEKTAQALRKLQEIYQ